jgi:hypothetical protein
MPLSPASRRFHVESASVARAVVIVNPVTTTLGKPFPVESPVKRFTITTPQFPFA